MTPEVCPQRTLLALPSPAAAPATATPPRRLLLVEDDPLQARGLLRLLGASGFTCHGVQSAAAALAAIARQPAYDAIVTDLGLPGLSGAELALRLRRPLLLAYSGHGSRPPGFDAHVEKPRIGALLGLLGARRIGVVLLDLGAAVCLGQLADGGLRCHGSSPAHALRILAAALEGDAH